MNVEAVQADAKKPCMQIPAETKPGSKNRYVLPTVVGVVSIITSLGLLTSMLSKQIESYTSNAKATKELWMGEGMKEEALEISIMYLTKLKLGLSSSLTNQVITFLIQICIAMFTENWIISGKNANNIIETVAILYYQALPIASACLSLISMSLLCGLFAVSSLGTFYYFTKKKISWKEQIVYGYFLYIVAQSLAILLLDDNKDITYSDKIIPIMQYEAIDGDLRARIVKAGNDNGIDTESIFIKIDDEVNAFATEGMRFKYMFITTSMLRTVNADQLMSVVYHEVGHVINRHITKGVLVDVIFVLFLLGVTVV